MASLERLHIRLRDQEIEVVAIGAQEGQLAGCVMPPVVHFIFPDFQQCARLCTLLQHPHRDVTHLREHGQSEVASKGGGLLHETPEPGPVKWHIFVPHGLVQQLGLDQRLQGRKLVGILSCAPALANCTTSSLS